MWYDDGNYDENDLLLQSGRISAKIIHCTVFSATI